MISGRTARPWRALPPPCAARQPRFPAPPPRRARWVRTRSPSGRFGPALRRRGVRHARARLRPEEQQRAGVGDGCVATDDFRERCFHPRRRRRLLAARTTSASGVSAVRGTSGSPGRQRGAGTMSGSSGKNSSRASRIGRGGRSCCRRGRSGAIARRPRCDRRARPPPRPRGRSARRARRSGCAASRGFAGGRRARQHDPTCSSAPSIQAATRAGARCARQLEHRALPVRQSSFRVTVAEAHRPSMSIGIPTQSDASRGMIGTSKAISASTAARHVGLGGVPQQGDLLPALQAAIPGGTRGCPVRARGLACPWASIPAMFTGQAIRPPQRCSVQEMVSSATREIMSACARFSWRMATGSRRWSRRAAGAGSASSARVHRACAVCPADANRGEDRGHFLRASR